MRRAQVYLGDEELELLGRAARATGASRSELIRRAVRSTYGQGTAARLRALDASAGSWRDRGRPVAQLTPYQEELGYERLLREGRIAPGTGASLDQILTELDAALPPDEGRPVTEVLMELRTER